MSSVTFSSSVGGDNSTVTDDASPTTGLANGGHRARFVPALSQTVAVAANTVTQATNAAASASAASTSAGNAATSATNSQNSFLSADKKYLGAKASAPTLDNQGAALATGAEYWNTTNTTRYIWNGSAWVVQTFVPTAASGVSFGPIYGLTATDVQAELASAAAMKFNIERAIRRARLLMFS